MPLLRLRRAVHCTDMVHAPSGAASPQVRSAVLVPSMRVRTHDTSCQHDSPRMLTKAAAVIAQHPPA